MGVQEPGPLGIAFLHSIAPVQQGFVTTGHDQNVFVGVSNEGRRCSWPQAQGQMTADLTPHSYGGQSHELESLICCYPYLLDSFSLSPLSFWICSLCHCCLDSEKRFRHSLIEAVCAVCHALVVLIVKVEVVGEFRNIMKMHGLVAFVHEARQWLKASHPFPRRQVLLSPPPCLLLQSAKQSTWPVPGNYPVPLDLSPALLSYVQISWVQIIKL